MTMSAGPRLSGLILLLTVMAFAGVVPFEVVLAEALYRVLIAWAEFLDAGTPSAQPSGNPPMATASVTSRTRDHDPAVPTRTGP